MGKIVISLTIVNNELKVLYKIDHSQRIPPCLLHFACNQLPQGRLNELKVAVINFL